MHNTVSQAFDREGGGLLLRINQQILMSIINITRTFLSKECG